MDGNKEVMIKKKRKGIRSLLVFLFAKPKKFSYLLKKSPDNIKYKGIRNDRIWSEKGNPYLKILSHDLKPLIEYKNLLLNQYIQYDFSL